MKAYPIFFQTTHNKSTLRWYDGMKQSMCQSSNVSYKHIRYILLLYDVCIKCQSYIVPTDMCIRTYAV